MEAASNIVVDEISQVRGENSRLREKVAQLQVDINDLQALLRFFQKLPFTPTSERYANQPLLFPDTPEALASAEARDGSVDATEVKGHTRKKKRAVIPADIPREVRFHDVPEDQKVCPNHGVALERSGDQISHKVEWIPAKIKVFEDVCAVYCCPICEKNVKIAELPPSPIPGSIATASLLAHIATAKYADGLPLYRQEGILQRHGFNLTRTTMATWMGRLAGLLAPLYNLFADVLFVSPVIYIDETHLQVLKVAGKKPTSKSYLWVRVGGISGQRVVLFDFGPGRGGDVAKRLIEGYEGFVTTDGYDGYNIIEGLKGVRRLQCWMHVRRYFKKALKVLGKAGKGGIADQGLKKIQDLYAIERACAEFTDDERYKFRLERSKPLLDEFHVWLQAAFKDVPPKGVTGVAINYALERWPYLTVFLEDGCLLMDNGPAENAIRPVAVGRKGWLFSDTVEGAETTAMLYSIVETAKANGKDPHAYLTMVIDRLPHAKTLADVEALLPWAAAPPLAASG